MYKLSGVTKNYAKGRGTVAALRGVDLVIEDGEWLAVQGPTGHGKSTLLQILGGLDRPSAGIVDFDGQDLAQLRETEVTRVRAQSIGFVFQTFNLIPTLSAQENVEAALVPLHVSATARRQRAQIALEAVALGDRLRHVPSELSGGQQQRVAIARALVKEPKVLLADEPTGNLDEDTRDDIIGLLETMWRERGLTMVVVTHDSSIARRAQRIGIMKNGRLTFRQPRPGRAQPARAQAGARPAGSQAVGSESATSRPGARTATAQAEPAASDADLQPPDMPVYADADLTDRYEPGPADLAEPDLTDLDDTDLDDTGLDDSGLDDSGLDDSGLDDTGLDDSGSLDEPDSLADSDSEPADTVRFD